MIEIKLLFESLKHRTPKQARDCKKETEVSSGD